MICGNQTQLSCNDQLYWLYYTASVHVTTSLPLGWRAGSTSGGGGVTVIYSWDFSSTHLTRTHTYGIM